MSDDEIIEQVIALLNAALPGEDYTRIRKFDRERWDDAHGVFIFGKYPFHVYRTDLQRGTAWVFTKAYKHFYKDN